MIIRNRESGSFFISYRGLVARPYTAALYRDPASRDHAGSAIKRIADTMKKYRKG